MPALIPEWKSSWKFTSLQAGWVLGFFNMAYAADFWGLQGSIGVAAFGVVNAVIVSIVIPWLRNIQQAPVVPPEVKAEMQAKVAALPTTETPQVQSVKRYIDGRIEELKAQIKALEERAGK